MNHSIVFGSVHKNALDVGHEVANSQLDVGVIHEGHDDGYELSGNHCTFTMKLMTDRVITNVEAPVDTFCLY